MTKKTKRKPRKAFPPQVSLGGIFKEELPFPYVHYPRHYGTFFAFSTTESSEPYLCECSVSPISNYIKLYWQSEDSDRNGYKQKSGIFDDYHFPESLNSVQFSPDSSPNDLFRFRNRLCHRCNLSPPIMRWCHEMYGVKFTQFFGWYVNQQYLRLGISPDGGKYLEDVTPEYLIEDIMKIREARMTPFGLSYNIGLKEARILEIKIENIIREEFGFKKVGERWTSETLLFSIVCKIYPDFEALRHYRPDWLEGLELDIFIPSLKLAFEYQGQQHFHPIEAWGGEEALLELQERDKRKAWICNEKGVHLIAVDYSEPLIQDYIQKRIKDDYEDKFH